MNTEKDNYKNKMINVVVIIHNITLRKEFPLQQRGQ